MSELQQPRGTIHRAFSWLIFSTKSAGFWDENFGTDWYKVFSVMSILLFKRLTCHNSIFPFLILVLRGFFFFFRYKILKWLILIQPLHLKWPSTMTLPELLKHFTTLQEETRNHFPDFWKKIDSFFVCVKYFHTADMIGTPTHAVLNSCCYGNLGGYYYYHMTYFGLLYTIVLWDCRTSLVRRYWIILYNGMTLIVVPATRQIALSGFGEAFSF